MSNAPEKTKSRKIKSLNDIMENNKFVFLLSLFIAFIVWVAVAMYASPEETFTVYNVPITIDTQNSIVSQKGYQSFWQSADKIDVTVTGPRYLVTALTPEDILVSANLNTVDSAGISQLALKVSLRQPSQDITISAQSKTSVEVYFDVEKEKVFDIHLDTNAIAEKVADGYQLNSAELTVSTITLKGPETEINKIVSIVATPELPEELLFTTQTFKTVLSLEGASTVDTVSVNTYFDVKQEEYFVKVSIDRLAELAPEVAFTGEKTGEATVRFNTTVILAKIATESGYDSESLPILTVDYSELSSGINKYSLKASELDLPAGVTVNDETFTYNITITFTPYD